jgi:hypothetical protein
LGSRDAGVLGSAFWGLISLGSIFDARLAERQTVMESKKAKVKRKERKVLRPLFAARCPILEISYAK